MTSLHPPEVCPQALAGQSRTRALARNWRNAWNWKCALLSAVARSAVYAVALARLGANSPAWRDGLAVVAVELMYVTLTAGLYAGLQQQALGLRRRWLGDLAVVVGVPGLSQLVDWGVHWLAGAPTPHKALATVLGFTLLSALFHRHVMRHGTFLTGKHGGSLIQDFRRIPALVASFALWPMRLARRLPQRLGYAAKLAA